MTDIVERMRSENMVWSVSEAADEIERLREREKLLEETLLEAAIALEFQDLYEVPHKCRMVVKGENYD